MEEQVHIPSFEEYSSRAGVGKYFFSFFQNFLKGPGSQCFRLTGPKWSLSQLLNSAGQKQPTGNTQKNEQGCEPLFTKTGAGRGPQWLLPAPEVTYTVFTIAPLCPQALET